MEVTYCAECGRPATDTHHCIYGKNRANSEKHKKYCTVRLCHECHMRLHQNDQEMDDRYKAQAQERFEEVYGHAEWMRVFGRNYRKENK